MPGSPRGARSLFHFSANRVTIYKYISNYRKAGDILKNIKERLYLSTIAEDDFDMAEEYGLGLEIAEFCTAMNMDGELYEIFDGNVRIKMRSADRFVFHGPFADLAPCCIDPRVRQVSMERYIQAVKLAEHYGIKRIVLHSGFIPQVHFPHWYHEEGEKFWKELLAQLPQDVEIYLENVMDPNPGLLTSLVRKVADPRLGLCLDVGHANATESHTVLQWLEAFKPWLRHVHIHNNDGIHDRHDALNEGTIDMRAVLDWLNEHAPDATITIENMTCCDSVQWLEEEGYL